MLTFSTIIFEEQITVKCMLRSLAGWDGQELRSKERAPLYSFESGNEIAAPVPKSGEREGASLLLYRSANFFRSLAPEMAQS